jgi:hypothetical protein
MCAEGRKRVLTERPQWVVSGMSALGGKRTLLTDTWIGLSFASKVLL